MKTKYIIGLALTLTLITSASSVEVLDIAVSPDNPRHGDSVNVTAYVDGEGQDINSVDVDIREDGDLIADDVPMNQVSGDEENIAGYKAVNAFTVSSDDTKEWIYDLNTQAIDVNGNADSFLLTVDVNQNSTQLDKTNPDEETKTVVFGLTLLDIIMSIGIVLFMWAVFRE